MKFSFKTLSLVLIALMSTLTVKADNVQDVISRATVFKSAGEMSTASFSDVVLNSGAKYSGIAFSSYVYNCIVFQEDNGDCIYNTTTKGKITSVTVNWNSDCENGMNLQMFFSANPITSANLSQAEKRDVIYSGSATTVVTPSAGMKYIYMRGKSDPIITSVAIDWQTISSHTISVSQPANGSISVANSKTAALEEESYSFTITPNSGYELYGYYINYTYYALDAATTEAKTFTKTMGTENVVISADIRAAVQRTDVWVRSLDASTTYSVTSGETVDFGFKVVKKVKTTPIKTSEVEVAYDGTPQFKIANTSIIQLGATSATSVSLTAKARGTTTLTISLPQTDKYTATNDTRELVVTVTVNPKEITLVSIYEGKYYAMKTTKSGTMLAAQEVAVANGKVINPTDDMKWYLSASGSGYAIQDANGKFLDHSDEDFVLNGSAPAVPWKLYNGAFGYDGTRFLIYDAAQGKFGCFNSMLAETAGYSSKAKEYGMDTKSEFTRASKGEGSFGTICVPFSTPMSMVMGASFLDIVGAHRSGDVVTGVVFAEHTGDLVAGHSYVIKMTSSNDMKIYYDPATVVSTPVDGDGFVGNLSSTSVTVPQGMYVISSNQVRKVTGNGVKVGQYKAYINLNGIGEPSAVVGRYEILAAPDATTDIEEVAEQNTIDWNAPVYNVLGQRVGEGATGVLIQNGKKFYVNK